MIIRTYRVYFFLLFLMLPGLLYSVDFKFQYSDGDNYRIVSEVQETVKVNDEILFSKEFLNRIAVAVSEVYSNRGDIDAVYQISERTVDGGVYQWNSEEYARFTRDLKGVYSGAIENTTLPSVRDIPRFPDGDVKPGEKWVFPGEEIHDLNSIFGINYVIRIPFNAFYTYEGTIEKNGKI
ncbi:MAG: OmpA family protein, partial [Spirochaetaceae bacterium]|nr:OmpA family protein [Spirochaetaceae bacterium]